MKHEGCEICGSLKDHEYIYYKDGSDDCNKLPVAFENLREVKKISPGVARSQTLLACPKCKTYYFHKVDYEFFPNGSENEEWLDRLSGEENKEINQSVSAPPLFSR